MPPKPKETTMPEHRVFLAGTKHGQCHLFRGDVPEGTVLELERQPDNPYDANAVAVYITRPELNRLGCNVDPTVALEPRLKLGMMPAARGPNWARILSELLAAGKPVTCTWRRLQENMQIRVVVSGDDLPETV
jgi:hypothetical protein